MRLTPNPDNRVAVAWRHVLPSLVEVDLTRFEPLAALRCTVGVGLPLIVVLLLGQPGAGVFIAAGAVSVGFGSFQGAYRSRALTMLCASAGMTLSIFFGSLAGHSTLTATAAAATWAFAAGLLIALGPSAGFGGLQSAVAVLVAGAYPSDIEGAINRAGLVLLGGLLQTLFVIGIWPLRRFRFERSLVSSVFRSLAGDARRMATERDAPPDAQALSTASAVHEDPHPFARPNEALVFQALLDQAERLRTGLATLSVAPAHRDPAVAEHVATLLTAIADAIEDGREPAASPREWGALDEAARTLRGHGTPIDALLGQLRAAWRTASVPSPPDESGAVRVVGRMWTVPPVRDALATLLANLSLKSTACRHGLRLAIAVGFATAVYRVVGLPRGYWFAMTTLFVLKPEFRETFVIGSARMVGTLAGGGLATLLVLVLGTHHAILTILLLAFVWSGYALFRANYTLFTICMTGYLVLLLTLAGVAGTTAAWYRIVDTVLGGALGLTIYAVWPTWESTHLRAVLATFLDGLADDATLLFGMYVEPARWNPRVLMESRGAARLARSNVEASVERMLGEPSGSHTLDAATAVSVLAAARRYALGALALHARLDVQPVAAHPEVGVLGAQLAESLRALAAAVRTGTALPPLPHLRETHVAIDAAGFELAAETDMMVDSVNTMTALLARPSSFHR
jgi:hypothetical protein